MATLINNIDVNALGIYLARHGAEEFFTLPDMSAAESNDWQELDGIQVDFTTIERKSPEVIVRYVLTSLAARTILEEYHKAESITLAPHGWGRTFTLSNAQQDSCKVHGKTGGDMAIEVNYRYKLEDIPSDRVTTSEPIAAVTSYKLGGVSLSQYGVVVNEADMLFAPHDFKDLTFARKDREVNLQCTILASTWSALWANRAALWTALQGELLLTTEIDIRKARYLSCSGAHQVGNRPVISFTLNLQLLI